MFPETGEPPKTIMVTSATRGEGKSFVTSNLAVSIASSIDEHVLLIDCDLHKPSIHQIFRCANDKGLSSFLTHGGPLSSFMIKTGLNKLTIIPGGKTPNNPSELISSEQMRRLISEAKMRYEDRYILIDTPPTLITSETNALAKHVDGILLVVKHGYTRKDHIQEIVDTHGKEKILGVVYNFVKDRFGRNYQNNSIYGYT